MAEFLLELLSEEIPARMQERAAQDLKRLVCDRLTEAGLAFEKAEAFATPRRLTLVVDGLPKQQPDTTVERKGPRVGAPEKAVQGFLKSAGLDSLDQCEVREVKEQKFYFVVSDRKGQKTEDLLQTIIPGAVPGLPWPKSMRWGDTPFRWVRPLHNVMGIFDGQVLKGGLFGLPFRSTTFGHRFLAAQSFEIKNLTDYIKKLRNAYVMLDAAERRRVIERDAAKLTKAAGLAVKPDPGLVAETAGLVEWPVVLMGRIDPEFMAVPPEVLTTAMRHHLKHFAVLDKDGSLAPRFVVVAGIRAKDKGKQIVAGNERVLRARLADAKFFWDQDRKRSLAGRAPALAGIVFHARLGSLDQKVDRVQALAVELAAHVPGADKDRVRSAARLAKADLTTGMVGEFPELQGVMGRYYALNDGEHEEVADAIAEHYAPLGPGDACPTRPVSIAVALADKIDTLVGFWAIDEKPTGSRDPYALRRAALGVIRLIVENGLRLPLRETFIEADRLLAETHAELRGRCDRDDLLDFFADRLKVHLRAQGVRHDLISAVFALGHEDDLVRLLARVAALDRFLGSDDGAPLLTAYRRAANIVRIEEKRDGVRYDGAAIDDSLLKETDEIAVAECLKEVSGLADEALGREDFAAAMGALARLRAPVDGFFDNVTVNCDDGDLRRNRLLLLGRIRATLDRVADFSQIEG